MWLWLQLGFCQLTILLTLNVEHMYVTSHGDSWPQEWNSPRDEPVTFAHFRHFSVKLRQIMLGSANSAHLWIRNIDMYRTHLHRMNIYRILCHYFGAKFKIFSENLGVLTENLLWRLVPAQIFFTLHVEHTSVTSDGDSCPLGETKKS